MPPFFDNGNNLKASNPETRFIGKSLPSLQKFNVHLTLGKTVLSSDRVVAMRADVNHVLAPIHREGDQTATKPATKDAQST